MKAKEVAKRYLLFVASLFFVALGVALSKIAELGISPISSVSNVLSLRFTQISLGTWAFLWNSVMTVGQIVLLRKNFQLIQLLQFPLSLLFGLFTDGALWCVSFIPAETYPARLALVLAGVAVMGFGISLSLIANVILNAGEGFVRAVADTLHRNFGSVKVVFDLVCVALAAGLSLLFFDSAVQGVREGTLIAAVGTGFVVKFFNKRLTEPVERMLTK